MPLGKGSAAGGGCKVGRGRLDVLAGNLKVGKVVSGVKCGNVSIEELT